MSSAVLFRQRTAELDAWLALRRAHGADRYDEVWEGVYVVNPVPKLGHAEIAGELWLAMRPSARAAGLKIVQEVNVGRPDDFRIPDVTVLPGDADPNLVYHPVAVIAVEILSPHERGDEKLPFYLAQGLREVAVVDWPKRSLRWFVAGADGWVESDRSEVLGLAVTDIVAAVAWP
jgi:hypothetical protein